MRGKKSSFDDSFDCGGVPVAYGGGRDDNSGGFRDKGRPWVGCGGGRDFQRERGGADCLTVPFKLNLSLN